MSEKQLQKAGANSQQIQANSITIINGIEEKRAREIFGEMFNIARKELTDEAYSIATQRVTEFENDLIPKMGKIEGAMDAFSDPGFQLLLQSAHKTAASTERSDDYSLLSELLIHRIQKGSSRKIRAGISRAVEIVDEISDDALLGLTVAFAIEKYIPISTRAMEGLDILDVFFGKTCYGTLPKNREWLEHLDILDAVRISTYGKLKTLDEFYSITMSEYCTTGIKRESENHKLAIEMLNKSNIPLNILVYNSLNSEYLKLDVMNESNIDSLEIIIKLNGSDNITRKDLTESQKQVLHEIYKMYDMDENMKLLIKNKFIEELNKRPNLAKIKDWWNKIPVPFSITAVGRVLAYSNAKRCDESLPPLYTDEVVY